MEVWGPPLLSSWPIGRHQCWGHWWSRIGEQGRVCLCRGAPPQSVASPVLPRPPGHHAQHSLMDGYCMFNHVAVAARYAQKKHAIQRSATSRRAGVMGVAQGRVSWLGPFPQDVP